jgi:integrase
MALQSWLTTDVRGHETQRKVRELLRMVLRDAVRDGRIPFSPAAELADHRAGGAQAPGRPPAADVRSSTRWCAPQLHPWYRPLVDFAEDTGMRPQEYAALRLCNVDTEAGIAYVREVVIDDKGTMRRQLIPKSSAALRTVPLTPKALAAIEVMVARLAPAAARSAIEDGMCPEELVFRGPLAGEVRKQKDGSKSVMDSVLNRNNLHRVWLPAIKAAGIARQVKNPETGRTEWWPRLYDYRHAVASRLHAAGLPEAVVQAFLGQERGSRVTWLYTHTTDEELGSARDVLAGDRPLRVVPDAARFHADSTRTAQQVSDALGATGTEGSSPL